MKKDIYPDALLVVMAGGSGTRFWPMSRGNYPKQFLPLGNSGEALIVEAVKRFEPLVKGQNTLVVTSSAQRPLVQEFLPDSLILEEPFARNTAPCLSYAAHYVLRRFGDIPMICIPADHVIDNQKEFLNIFKKAIKLAKSEDVLITLGIKPTSPETGYGYIKRGAPFVSTDKISSGSFQVSQFVEKPDLDTAKHYVESGDFYWNSGMFVWRPSVLIKAFDSYLPDISKAAQNCVNIIDGLKQNESQAEAIKNLYEEMTSVSIDVGIMEEAENAIVFPCHGFRWSDVGSWSSWSDEVSNSYADGHNNIFLGDVVSVSSQGCTVINAESESFNNLGLKFKINQQGADKNKMLALVGMEDIVIVNLPDTILVCKKEDTQKVKQIVEILSKKGKTELI